MGVGIIGAGSIGMLIGSYLADCNLDVTMLVRNEVQKDLLNEKGINCINDDGTSIQVVVNAVTEYEKLATMELVIVAVKYQDVQSVLQTLKEKKIQVPLLFIQNGIAHLQDVQESDFQHVAFATVEHGALKEDAYTVRHNGVGKITIGERFGDARKFDILEQVNCERFPVTRNRDAAYILLRKGLINCLINPLTTILGVANGELVQNANSHQLMRALYEELINAFPEMAEDLPFTAIESICHRTSRNYSSMYADYLAGRPMEIETIVSAVILKAERKGKCLQLLRTYENILLVLDRKAYKK